MSDLAVLEVTQLRLKGVAPDDPSLHKNLSLVRGILRTQSVFYSCIQDPTLLFILGIWPSLEAHREFLASSRAAEVLGPQEAMLDFVWSAHMELDAMAALPLDAPVLSLTRRTVKGHDVDAYDKTWAKERRAMLEGSKHRVASGWRLDAAPGTHEFIIFAGWESAEAHAAFDAGQSEPGNGDGSSPLYETMTIHTAWNVEATRA
ncbi:hypothetical protein N0V90_009014 [Kalmusia sp. IMI 367209]|nr:hypothetical protein N0V90_009014 [Kalmusia sp. IMI 367209]